MLDKIPRESSVKAKLSLQHYSETSVGPEECNNHATGRGDAETPLLQGEICTRDKHNSICLKEPFDGDSLYSTGTIRSEQDVDSITFQRYHSSDHDVGTVGLGKKYDSETDRYEVEKILGHKYSKGLTFYRVKWKGYRRATWEPAVNLDDCAVLLEAYRATIFRSSKVEA